jgi:DNA-binding transcriptional LysR family regulator
MELRQLRQFIAVAEEHSFRRAAERLCMAQPPLSVAIRKLEEEIGVPLFERGSRGVVPTPAGVAALEAARRCLDIAADVKVAALAAADGETGRLRIGFIGSVTFGLLPRLIQDFRQRHSQVTLDLRESNNLELLTLVANHQLDLAFVRLPVVRMAGLALRTVEQDVFCVALPPGHPLAAFESLSVRQLEGEPCIGYTPSRVGGLQAGMAQLLEECGVAPRITQEAVQVQTVVGLVSSGLGIALIPSANVPLMTRKVEYRPLNDLPDNARIGIALIYRAGDSSPVVKRFLDMVDVCPDRNNSTMPRT